MRAYSAVVVIGVNLMAQTQPDPLLVVHRDFIKPGKAAAYHAIELDTARRMRQAAPLDREGAVRFPNAYLAVESLTGAQEVWFLTAWKSREDYERVGQEYSQAPKDLIRALNANAKKRAEVTLAPVTAIATYRGDLGSGQFWKIGRDRYLVIATARPEKHFKGIVYETEDHTLFVIRAAESRSAAEKIAAGISPEARVFEVRPDLSRPAAEWVAADIAFWAQAKTAR
jgi:hypothetical protein